MGGCCSGQQQTIGDLQYSLMNYNDMFTSQNRRQFGGDITYYSNKQHPQVCSILKKFTTHNDDQYRFLTKEIKSRFQLKHNNIGRIIGLNEQTEDFCSLNYQVDMLMECSNLSLLQEIENRKAQNQYFSEKELCIIMCEIISALNYYIKTNIKHCNIRLDYIYMCNKNEFNYSTNTLLHSDIPYFIKLQDPLIFFPDSNYQCGIVQKLDENPCVYLSPQEMRSIELMSQPNHNPYKSDLFSIGMSILHCGLLENNSECYDIYNYRFQEQILKKKLQKLSRIYTKDFVKILSQLLLIDDTLRPDPIDIQYVLQDKLSAYFLPPQQDPEPVQYMNYSNEEPQNLNNNNYSSEEQQQQNSQKQQPQQIQHHSYYHDQYLTQHQNQNLSMSYQQQQQNQNQQQQYLEPIQEHTEHVKHAKHVNNKKPKNEDLYKKQYEYNNNNNQQYNPNKERNTYQADNNNYDNFQQEQNKYYQQQQDKNQSQNNQMSSRHSLDLPHLRGKGRIYKIGNYTYEVDKDRHEVRYGEQFDPLQQGSQNNIIDSPIRQQQTTGKLIGSRVSNKNVQNQEILAASNYNNDYLLNNNNNNINKYNSKRNSENPQNFIDSNIQRPSGQKVSETYEDGSKYDGQKINGERNGYGVFTYPLGGRYEGYWKNDDLDGDGQLYGQDGQLLYKGYFKQGKFNGRGTQYNDNILMQKQQQQNISNNNQFLPNYKDLSSETNWASYEGNFINDLKEGQGIMSFIGGQRFEGEFHNNMPHGQGTYYSHKYPELHGIWVNGIFSKEIEAGERYSHKNQNLQFNSNKNFNNNFESSRVSQKQQQQNIYQSSKKDYYQNNLLN